MSIEIKSMFCKLRNIFKDVLITPHNRIHLVTKLLSHLVDYRKRKKEIRLKAKKSKDEK